MHGIGQYLRIQAVSDETGLCSLIETRAFESRSDFNDVKNA